MPDFSAQRTKDSTEQWCSYWHFTSGQKKMAMSLCGDGIDMGGALEWRYMVHVLDIYLQYERRGDPIPQDEYRRRETITTFKRTFRESTTVSDII